MNLIFLPSLESDIKISDPIIFIFHISVVDTSNYLFEMCFQDNDKILRKVVALFLLHSI